MNCSTGDEYLTRQYCSHETFQHHLQPEVGRSCLSWQEIIKIPDRAAVNPLKLLNNTRRKRIEREKPVTTPALNQENDSLKARETTGLV